MKLLCIIIYLRLNKVFYAVYASFIDLFFCFIIFFLFYAFLITLKRELHLGMKIHHFDFGFLRIIISSFSFRFLLAQDNMFIVGLFFSLSNLFDFINSSAWRWMERLEKNKWIVLLNIFFCRIIDNADILWPFL